MKAYGDSDHIVSVSKLFNQLKENPEEQFISYYNATDMRNYLMSVLALVNCLRASNLINMTLDDVDKAQKDTTIQDAYVIKSKKYKVSIIYGAKMILATNEIFEQLQLYIKHVRPRFISDTHRLNRDRYVFVSSQSDDKVATKPEPMNQSMVSQCLTRSFEKSEVFQGKESFPRMSCSRIRFSIITELICLGTEELENIAHCFAKHDKKVCKRCESTKHSSICKNGTPVLETTVCSEKRNVLLLA